MLGGIVSFYQILIEQFVSNYVDPDQVYAMSGLGLHCLLMSHKKNARLILVNIKLTWFVKDMVNVFHDHSKFKSVVLFTITNCAMNSSPEWFSTGN